MNQTGNTSTSIILYSNKSTVRQGEIENNPGYGKYITDISNGKPFNYSNTGGNALSNATGSVGESLTNTSKTVGSSLEKGISSILNLGNNSGK